MWNFHKTCSVSDIKYINMLVFGIVFTLYTMFYNISVLFANICIDLNMLCATSYQFLHHKVAPHASNALQTYSLYLD
jgi:hypothetical protein